MTHLTWINTMAHQESKYRVVIQSSFYFTSSTWYVLNSVFYNQMLDCLCLFTHYRNNTDTVPYWNSGGHSYEWLQNMTSAIKMESPTYSRYMTCSRKWGTEKATSTSPHNFNFYYFALSTSMAKHMLCVPFISRIYQG